MPVRGNKKQHPTSPSGISAIDQARNVIDLDRLSDPNNEWSLKEKIGLGSYSQVFKVVNRRNCWFIYLFIYLVTYRL